MTTNEQLELGFGGIRLRAAVNRHESRVARADWWFARMRQIVDRATDWAAVTEPRPEQIWIPGASREVKV